MKTQSIVSALRNATSPSARLAAWQSLPVSKRLAAIRDRLTGKHCTSSCTIHGEPTAAKWRNAFIHDPAFYLAPVPCVYQSEDGRTVSLSLESFNSPLVADFWSPQSDRTMERAIGHTGWFTDDDFQEETICPVAVELKRFPGIIFEGTIESMGGMISVDLTSWDEVDFSDCHCEDDAVSARFDTAKAAIQSADSTAQRMAEEEREYQRKWRAENDIAENRETLAGLRQEIRALCHELKQLCPSPLASEFPAAGKAVRDSLKSLLRDRRELMATNAELSASL